jgi:hypothetical protein
MGAAASQLHSICSPAAQLERYADDMFLLLILVSLKPAHSALDVACTTETRIPLTSALALA